ncbi:5-carboxymethyl-2-hydroxymuconate isomerase [Sphingobium sp. Leaf26]|uniref:fumarylacetoacetate hydrolase family protein n=1 Tax=Sphingobium sp. Leaf26 TaxID=1735693 RepID=UPI0006F40464|nr:fumarylacetoacetate hydrolase family protein [Sphingobium sp. Leaf26]KQM99354.1 5-carboxymethyl-2-hydroxymuconate isomerase [Sphingobium sp. Leaf26]
MKLARFTANGTTRIGKVVDDQIVDLSQVPGVTGSMRQLLEDLPRLRDSLERATDPALPLASVRLEAPIADPQKFLAIGMNYKAHAEEAAAAGISTPKSQLWFNKQVSCIAGPSDAIVRPQVSDKLDYEAELAYVIGKRCRHVDAKDALDVVAGYMVANDVSVRDWQHRSPTYTLGKSFDTHGPIGPWITTADEVADAQDLSIRLTVDGVERQQARTNDLIYGIAEQIAYLTTVMTLYPGDVIATGTPSGVAAVDENWLKPGQVVRVEIEKLGAIENTVEAEVVAA